MVSIKSALTVMAMSMVANGIVIPSVDDMGLAERGESGVLLLEFRVTQGLVRKNGISKRDAPEETLFYETGLIYDIDLVVGSQKDPVTVHLDTGSSDLWVVSEEDSCKGNWLGAPPNCTAGGVFDQTKSSTWKEINETFFAFYGDLTGALGITGLDSVGFPNGPTLSNFQFGVATIDTAGVGILGVGPLTGEAGKNVYNYSIYPNFPQALKDQGYINKVAYSLYLNEPTAKTGNIVFGGYDTEKYYGSLVAQPIDSNIYLSVNLDSTTTAGGNKSSVNAPAVLDSGTNGIIVPQDVIDSVTAELKGYNGTAGLYSCDQDSKALTFGFNGVSIPVPYSDLVTPATDNLGNFLGYCEVILVYEKDTPNILGTNFLRHAYVLYDLEDRNISLAPVKYTDKSNLVSL